MRAARPGLYELLDHLTKAELPPPAWVDAWSADGDPLAAAWQASGQPHVMVRVLAVAEHPDVDSAAEAALARAVSIARREKSRPASIPELERLLRSPTPAAELSHALHGLFIPGLRSPRRREHFEAEIAEAIRAAVAHPPQLAALAPKRQASAPSLPPGSPPLAQRVGEPDSWCVLTATEVRAGSRGQVVTPLGFGRLGPELGGLRCERAFGRWSPRSPDLTRDDRSGCWGFVALREPVAHPAVPGATLSLVPVVPPHYRRFTWVDGESLRRRARERRAELEARDDGGQLPEKVLAAEGLDDPDALTAGGLREHPLDTVYRAFTNLDRRIARMRELRAPGGVIDESRQDLSRWARVWVDVWREWLAELPQDVETDWALRALALRRR